MGATGRYAILNALRNIRRDKGLTQQELALLSGVSPYCIINFENGRSDRFKTALCYYRLNPEKFMLALQEGENGADI